MASCKSVVVLCPNARRQTVKVGPTTTILQILEEVCTKQKLSSQEYAIKHQKKILDETLPIRYSGLSNNAHLEVVLHTKTSKKDAPCTVALQLSTGERLMEEFPPEDSLWDVISHWNSNSDSPHHGKLFGEEGQDAVCVYMTQSISGENKLKCTSLKSLGLSGKRAVIRLLYEATSNPEQPVTIPATDKPSSSKNTLSERAQTSPVDVPKERPTDTAACSSSFGKEIVSNNENNVNPPPDNRNRQLDNKNVSPDRATKDPKRARIAGPSPLFPDFKFPERPVTEASKPQTPMVSEERLNYLATPCERCPLVFKEDDKSLAVREQDVPDSFYDVTIEDLRKMLQGLQSQRSKTEDMPLLTKAMRESRKLEEICKYERVVLRVKFPDRFALQGFFRPQEKVDVLIEFVKSHLQDPNEPFYLYTTPPKTVLKNAKETMYEAHLCPASLVYFGSNIKKDHYLADHLLTNVTTALDAEKIVVDSGIHSAPTPTSEQTNNFETDRSTVSSANETSTSNHSNSSVPPPGGSSGKVPKWFKGIGK